jgi:folate-binding protein YgfZ
MTLLFRKPGWVRRDVGVIRVSGGDRQHYLQQMLSQQVEGLAAGEVADFLFLDAKGVAQTGGRMVIHAEAVLLVVPCETSAAAAETLAARTFLMDAKVADVSEEFALASVRAVDPIEQTGARDQPMTAVPHPGDGGDPWPLAGGGLVIRDRSGGLDLLGAGDWVTARLHGLGLAEASDEDWHRWRILNAEPDWPHEVATGRRPQELGLLPTHVHLSKGCYPGQESIAKMYNLGKPRRGLFVLDLDGTVAAGDEVTVEGKTGQITSAAPDHEGSVALALLPLDRATGEVLGNGAVAVGDVPGRVVRRVGAGLAQPGATATA